MAHEIETMAWAGETPWHGLGKQVPHDLTPDQMLQAAGLDWKVKKIPAYANIDGHNVSVGRSALIRETDNQVLDIVGDDWNEVQNHQAAAFFNEFIEAGNMKLETAGSLKNGQIVWFLAKVDDSFELFSGDKVDAYMLFTNPHKFGQTTSVQFNPIRVVCHNTLSLAMSQDVKNIVRVSHRKMFDETEVKSLLGIAHNKMGTYKETASFLGSRKAKNEDVVEYFQRIFPVTVAKEEGKSVKELSRNAQRGLDILNTQPGAEYAQGSWWQVFNSVTFMTDHLIGRNSDNRLASAWYGPNRTLKVEALKTAVDYAEKSDSLLIAA